MGIEIPVDSLEDMCALMCDNVIPENKDDDKKKRGVPDHSENKSSTPHHVDRLYNNNII